MFVEMIKSKLIKLKKNIKVAIDSPAAAGAGTQARLISAHYNPMYLDTGKIYRLIGMIKLKKPKKFNYSLVKNEIKNLKIKKTKMIKKKQ